MPPAGACIDPLYLFCCGVLWHKQADASAGWELIHGLRSAGPEARVVASALLAKTENARLLVRDLRRGRSALGNTTGYAGKPGWNGSGEVAAMNTPYGLEIIESCLTCKLRKD